MTEPTSSTTAVAAATGAITLSGSVLGLEYQLLLVGMLGGLIALSFRPTTTRIRMAISVAISAILAGYATPVAIVLTANWMPSLESVHEALRLLLALLIGIATQTAIPAALKGLRRRLGGPEETP